MPSALDSEDFEAALEFVRSCDDAPDLPAYRRSILAVVEHVPGHLVSYNEVDLVAERVVSDVHPSDDLGEEDFAIFGRFAHQNPLIAHLNETGDLRARAISDFLDPDEFHELDLYRRFYERLEVEDQIAFGLSSRPELVIGVAICRRELGFSARDREFLDLIAPHAGEAYISARARDVLARSPTHRAGEPIQIIVLDEQDRIQSLDGATGELVERHFGAGVAAGDPLPQVLADYVQASRERLREPAALRTPPPQFTLEREGWLLRARFVNGEARADPDLLVLEYEPNQLTEAALRRLGLSPRESEIVGLLAEGATNAEIAARLHLSERTVKRHLANVFGKLGVQSRAGVVGRVLRG